MFEKHEATLVTDETNTRHELVLWFKKHFNVMCVLSQGGDDLDANYVLSSRIRTGRSIRGICLPPHCTRAERRAVERILTTALASLDGDLAGKYISTSNCGNSNRCCVQANRNYLCFMFVQFPMSRLTFRFVSGQSDQPHGQTTQSFLKKDGQKEKEKNIL